jgi:hypothetical protein
MSDSAPLYALIIVTGGLLAVATAVFLIARMIF